MVFKQKIWCKSFLVALICYFVASCAPLPSSVITDNGRAIFVDSEEGRMQVSNSISGEKRGISCVTNYFYIISVGDSSIKKAKLNGRIKNISRIEKTKSGFGFLFLLIPYNIGKSCTIVYGN